MNEDHWVKLSPMDTLFFRDHRPFAPGERIFGEQIDPTPLTFFGALGGTHCSRMGLRGFRPGKKDEVLGEFREALDDEDGCGFRVTAQFRVIGKHPCLPAPYHVFWNKKKRAARMIGPGQDVQEDERSGDGWASLSDIADILGEWDAASFHPIRDGGFEKEMQVGIGIDHYTGTTESGLFYTTNRLRAQEKRGRRTGFLIRYRTANDQPLSLSRTLRLGGEARLTTLETAPSIATTVTGYFDPLRKNLREAWEKPGTWRFLVMLTTPAIFREGLWPERWPWGENAKCVDCFSDKPIYVSGWRSWDRSPRPLFRAVPAGAVYFFESKDEELKEELLKNYLLGESVSEIYKQAGFGITLIGTWKT